jgi:hypothetical protein
MESPGAHASTEKGIIGLLAGCLLMIASASVQAAGPYEITWSTIDGGGGRSSGGSYVLTGTIGQADAAYSAGGRYELLGGFWPGGPICIVEFGDFAKFAGQWLETGSDLAADLDDSTVVDFVDLHLFAEQWLRTCPAPWPLK